VIDSDDLLRTELRQALDSRQPDRTAMLNRIAANRAAGPRRPRGRLLRLAASALAVVAALGVAQWAVAATQDPKPAAPPALSTPSPTHSSSPSIAPSSPSARPSSSPPRTTPTTTQRESPATAASPVRGHPGDTQVVKGSLSSTAAITAGTGSSVTLTAQADLTELDLTIRVAGAVTPAGTAADGDVTGTAQKQDGAVLYRFVLNKGATLPAGTYTFTARYAGGDRDSAQDTYEAYATSVEHKRIHIYGNFLPRD
jgi:cytoskeletal protein RodZ